MQDPLAEDSPARFGRRGLRASSVGGYAIGDFANNLYWGGASFFLFYWYTDVAGLAPKDAGLLLLAGSVFDALTDPAVGLVADRSRARGFTYRRFIAWGAAPLAFSFALLYWLPPLAGIELVAALLAAQILFRAAYSVVAVPYASLSARITRSPRQRTVLSGARMMAAYGGGLVISAAGFPLARYFGAGDERQGFFYFAAMAGVLAVVLHLVCVSLTPEAPQTSTRSARYTIRELLASALAKRSFLILLLAIPLFTAAGLVAIKCLVYYVKYGLDAHDQQETVLLWHGIVTLLATPVWVMVSQRIGKRRCWGVATIAVSLAALLAFIVEASGVPQFLLSWLPMSAGLAAVGVLFWSMLPDAVDRPDAKRPAGGEAAFFGLATFIQKVSIGLSAWLLGLGLSYAGFVPGGAQSASTVVSIKSWMTLVPAALMCLSWLAMRRYPMDHEMDEPPRVRAG
ncbi:MAG: MFS transporter [Pseudomonadota bacterium]